MAYTPKNPALDSGNPASEVTVLVFKDNLSARAFNIPLTWFTHLGTLLGVLSGFCLLASILAVKFYHANRMGDPGRVHSLEEELGQLRSSYQTLESRAQGLESQAAQAQAQMKAAQAQAQAAQAQATQAQAQAQTAAPAKPVPAPTQPVAAPVPISTAPVNLAAQVFSALPAKMAPPPAVADLPISIDSPRVQWSGRTLKVHFNIQYTKTDRGSQQGRIVILARGSETVLAYPEGVLGRTDSESLIQPSQGEYFSVGRFREVSAEFGPVASPNSLREVEVFLIGQNDSGAYQLLIHQSFLPESRPLAPARPAPKAKARPTTPRKGDTNGDAESAAPATPGAAAPATGGAAPTSGGANASGAGAGQPAASGGDKTAPPAPTAKSPEEPKPEQ